MNNIMVSKTGKIIPEEARGILYICKYNGTPPETLKVVFEVVFESSYDALQAYANVPNPESQLARGKDKESFHKELRSLHKRMDDPEWVKGLKEFL